MREEAHSSRASDELIRKNYPLNLKQKPLITVITVIYNALPYLEKTIFSVINQTYENIEFIIVDGGSTDGTLDIVKKYDNAINYWISEPDNGVYDAMNKGARLAKGEFICFLNAGDYFNSTNIIQKIVEALSSDVTILFGNYLVSDGANSTEVKAKGLTKLKLFFWSTRAVCHQAMFVRTQDFFPFDIRYRLKAELDWYFVMLSRGASCKRFPDPICIYSLGGLSDQNFSLEMKETILVMFKTNPFLTLFHLPVFLFKLLKRISM